MKLPPVHHRSVLITGCSSGIGGAAARMLRDRGWTVVPTARKEADLETLRQQGFRPVRLDIAEEESVAACAAEVLSITGGQLGAVVNNAGFGQTGALEDLDRKTIRQQFEVNVVGLQDLTNRFIPLMRKQGFGRIVNLSSVLGRVSTPFMATYCATKFAVEALSDALRVELHGSGIGVMLVEPGPIISEFRHNAAFRAQETLDLKNSHFAALYAKEIQRRIRQQKKPDAFTKPPEAVAEVIVHALESARPKRRYCVTIPAHLGAFVSRFFPDALIDAVLARKVPADGGG